MSLILASTSPIRRQLLTNAGVAFEHMAPDVDETKLKAEHGGLQPGALAILLAEAKAEAVSARYPGATVIGADQILNLDGTACGKPGTIDVAEAQLRALRGRTHTLETALACAEDGKIVWRHLAQPSLTMRNFSDGFLRSYLAAADPAYLNAAGSYQLEGLGAQLFEAVDADYFAILGLPLLPLLEFLRQRALVQA